jgi:D-alanyl-D-alanine carboxypeptidase
MEAAVDGGVIGVQLRVQDAQGEWTAGEGTRVLGGQEPPSTDGLFRVGSVSKTFTATVVLQLVAEGRLGLDDVVADHLPRFDLDPRITVRTILQNTSGVPSYTGFFPADDSTPADFQPGIPMSTDEWVEDRFRSYEPDELIRYALSLDPSGDDGVLFEPGTRFSYSNSNYTLATLLVEAITDRPYADELERRVLDPLGLRGTSFPVDSANLRGPHAHSYYSYTDPETGQERLVDITRQNPSWAPGAGNMISTTEDLQTFLTALTAGELVPEPLLTEMTTPHALTQYPRAEPTELLPYGLGVQVIDLGQVPGCEGVTLLNHNGGVTGSAALMYSTPDGSRTLTGSLTYDGGTGAARAGAAAGALVQGALPEVFCG